LKKSCVIFFIVLIVLSACEMKPLQLKPPLDGQGEVFLYLEPFPQEAGPLRFFLDKVSALKADGTDVSLALSFEEFKPSDLKRQRVIASGRLPAGSYSGLSFSVKRALLKGEEGEADLIVPKEPVKINYFFEVPKEKAVVISMNFKYSESVRGGVSFIPFFSLSIPVRPLISLKGLVSNHDSNTVTLFDKRLGKVASVIETGGGPGGMVLDQRARRAYVALSEDDAIDVIDIDRGDRINRMRLTTGDQPWELALTPDGTTLLTINRGSNSVSFVNPVTLSELKRINVGNNPASILLDRTGRKAYVFNLLSNSVSVIDVPRMVVAATYATETGPLRGQFSRKGDRLYVFYERAPYLTVFDPFNFSVINRVFVGAGVSDLKVDTNTGMLYLSRKYDGVIEVYDPFSLLPFETFNVGGGVGYMAIDNEGNNLCVVLPDRKRLVMVNLISKKVVSELDTGDYPYWTTMMGER
jgi:YVTN family beta-propeller protein